MDRSEFARVFMKRSWDFDKINDCIYVAWFPSQHIVFFRCWARRLVAQQLDAEQWMLGVNCNH